MFRVLRGVIFSATRIATSTAISRPNLITQNLARQHLISPIASRTLCSVVNQNVKKSLLVNLNSFITTNDITRSVTKYSYRKGKRKSVKAVLKRFYRLHWGGWIRTKCGRNKKLWRKSPPRKRRLRQHVFCNATQSRMLDKMVTKYWRKPKYYVEDPYEPYHSREEYEFTYTKPRPYIPPEER